VANYWDYDIRQTPAFYMNNVYRDINNVLQVRDITNSTFTNGLVHGTNDMEFQTEFNDLQLPSGLLFHYTMLRTTQATNNSPYFDASTIFRNQNPAFADASTRDFHIRSNSFAVDRGWTSPVLPGSFWDLDGVQRGGAFDLGCYQHTP
jgi:hypothetical protein